MSIFGPDPARVVISSAEADSEYLERCKIHLKPYVRSGKMCCWDRTMLEPGSDSQKCIEEYFACPKVGIVLISADYIADESLIIKKELSLLLAAAKRGDTVIMSVILSPCAFEYTELVVYQTVNPVSKPLSKLDWHHCEEVWSRLAEHIFNMS